MMGLENLEKSRARGQRVVPADTRACLALGAHFNHLAALPLSPQGQTGRCSDPRMAVKINSCCTGAHWLDTQGLGEGYSIIHSPPPFKLEINNLLANRGPREAHFTNTAGFGISIKKACF